MRLRENFHSLHYFFFFLYTKNNQLHQQIKNKAKMYKRWKYLEHEDEGWVKILPLFCYRKFCIGNMYEKDEKKE